MKKPILGYIFLVLIFAAFAYPALIQKPSLTTIEALPFMAGTISALALWIWMSVNCFRNRKMIKHPYLWGFMLVFANWVTAIVYFLFKYSPSEKTNAIRKFDLWLCKSDNRFDYYVKLAVICLVVATFHHYVMESLYTTFGIHNNKWYYLICVKLIYYPFSTLLILAYKALSIDTDHPSENIIIVGRVLNFIYTYLLFFILASIIMHFRIRKKNCKTPN